MEGGSSSARGSRCATSDSGAESTGGSTSLRFCETDASLLNESQPTDQDISILSRQSSTTLTITKIVAAHTMRNRKQELQKRMRAPDATDLSSEALTTPIRLSLSSPKLSSSYPTRQVYLRARIPRRVERDASTCGYPHGERSRRIAARNDCQGDRILERISNPDGAHTRLPVDRNHTRRSSRCELSEGQAGRRCGVQYADAESA